MAYHIDYYYTMIFLILQEETEAVIEVDSYLYSTLRIGRKTPALVGAQNCKSQDLILLHSPNRLICSNFRGVTTMMGFFKGS